VSPPKWKRLLPSSWSITLKRQWQFPIVDERGQPGAVHQPGSVTHNTEIALALLRHGKIRVRELVTHHASPEDCQRLYEGAVDRKDEQLGVLFHWA
jgi:threonine dehydrogenase-like Zn-dependent dehydrogenase